MRLFSKVFILAGTYSLLFTSQSAFCDQYDSSNFYDGSLTELGESERMRQATWGSRRTDPNTRHLMAELEKSQESRWVNSLITLKMERQNLEPWRTKGNVTLQFPNNNAVLELSSSDRQPAEIMQMIQMSGNAKSISFDNKVTGSSSAGRIEVYIREVVSGSAPTLLGAFPLATAPNRIISQAVVPHRGGSPRSSKRHSSSPHYEVTIRLVGGVNRVQLDNFQVNY